jgi:nicotinamide-nucleotide amidase
MANIKATIITIGDELLIGQTIDTNSAWLGQRLNDLGIEVVKRVAVGDVAEDITKALDEEIPRASIILLTGGLGPTSDDITKPLLRQYFGGVMVENAKVLAHVQQIFEKRNIAFIEAHRSQAMVPDSCTVLFNSVGTAPGMMFEKGETVIFSMPGVPFEMMRITEDEVIPRLRQRFISDAIIHRSILTSGIGESFIAERIADLEAALPAHIKLAYLPGAGMVKLRLTGRGKDELRLVKEITMRQEEIANRLNDVVIVLEDLPMESIVGKSFTVHKKTLGLAESCTGGNISHLITQVMGSAGYFQGCIVSYQDEIKEKILGVDKGVIEEKGAVCEEVAIQMAKGAMKTLGSDVGFGITGLLSGGGDDDKVPVGTVWMAVGDKNGIIAKKHRFFYDRIRNKELAVQLGLLMIWKFLNDKL